MPVAGARKTGGMARLGLTPAQLGTALAEVLGPVLPRGMVVEAIGGDLGIWVPDAPRLGRTLSLSSLLAGYNEGGVLEPGQIVHGCLSVLDDIQEVAVQVVGEAWPSSPSGLQPPGGKIKGSQVVLWFGTTRERPALTLAPMPIG